MKELRSEEEIKATENLIRAIRAFVGRLWYEGDAPVYIILKNTFKLTDEQIKEAAPDFWEDLKNSIRIIKTFLSEWGRLGDAPAYNTLKNVFELTDEQMKKVTPDFWKELKDECGLE